MEPKSHWDAVYQTKSAEAVSWYAPHLRESLSYIQRTGLPTSASIIDVGAGESTLVDDLLSAGYDNITVLDISEKALEVARTRMAQQARRGWSGTSWRCSCPFRPMTSGTTARCSTF